MAQSQADQSISPHTADVPAWPSRQPQLLVDRRSLTVLAANERAAPYVPPPPGELSAACEPALAAALAAAVVAIERDPEHAEALSGSLAVGGGERVDTRLWVEAAAPLGGRDCVRLSLCPSPQPALPDGALHRALEAADQQVAHWRWRRRDDGSTQLIGEAASFMRTVSEPDRGELMALLAAVAAGTLEHIDTVVSRAEGDAPAQRLHLVGGVVDAGREALAVVIADQTELSRIEAFARQRERELAQARDRLQRNEQELAELLASIPDFIVRADLAGAIRYASPSFAEACGRAAPTLIGQPLLGQLPSSTAEAVAQALGTLTADKGHAELITEQSLAGNARYFWWSLHRVSGGEQGEEVLLIGRDVSERHRARRDLERQARRLQRSNASLGDFASVISHDVRAPLRQMSNFANMLVEMRDELEAEDAEAMLKSIHDGAMRLHLMIERLREFSHVGLHPDRLAVVPLAYLLAEAVQTLNTEMRDSGAVLDSGPLPTLRVDPVLIGLLFQNLLSNSIKYVETSQAPRISLQAEPDGDEWLLHWRDQGIGVPANQSERIFRIFARAHKDQSVYAGQGVGLAVVKRVIESHGGDVWLDTDYSEGAQFTIRLPDTSVEEAALLNRVVGAD